MEYLKSGQYPAVQDMQTPKPCSGHLPLLKTWRLLGKSHSRKILVPAEVFEHQGVNLILLQ